MSETQGAAAAEATAERKRAEASNFLSIVRGRLPLVFVHAIRFDQTLAAMGNKDVAAKFATSVGKVFDIRKNRNFAYIGADYKPTTDDVAAAQGWIDAVGAENAKGKVAVGDKSLMQSTLDEYKSRGLASAEDAAALSAARTAGRKPKEKSNGQAGAATQTSGEASADALLN